MKSKFFILLSTFLIVFSSCQKKLAYFQASKIEDFSQAKNKQKLAQVLENVVAPTTQIDENSFVSTISEKVEEPIVLANNSTEFTESEIVQKEVSEKLNIQSKSIDNQQFTKKVGLVEKVKIAKKVAQIKKNTKANGTPGTDQLIALLLVVLVGALGIHRFYLGYTAIGIIQLLTLGGCGIWALIDLIRIITGDLKPYNSEYTRKI